MVVSFQQPEQQKGRVCGTTCAWAHGIARGGLMGHSTSRAGVELGLGRAILRGWVSSWGQHPPVLQPRAPENGVGKWDLIAFCQRRGYLWVWRMPSYLLDGVSGDRLI